MTRWEAASADQLREISGLIHDSYFDIDDVEHDAAAGTLSIAFAQRCDRPPLCDDPDWQRAPQPEFVRKTWRYTESRVPFMRGSLVVKQLESFTLDPAAGDAGMLLSVSHDEATGMLTIDGVSGALEARVRRVDVVAELAPDEVALYVRCRRGIVFGSMNPLWGWTPHG